MLIFNNYYTFDSVEIDLASQQIVAAMQQKF